MNNSCFCPNLIIYLIFSYDLDELILTESNPSTTTTTTTTSYLVK